MLDLKVEGHRVPLFREMGPLRIGGGMNPLD
jgi:hypothetical protein